MNILGMGPLELGVVLLIAFIILGPEKMVDTARKLGKMAREVRRMIDELPEVNLTEDDISPTKSASVNQRDGASQEVKEDDAAGPPEPATVAPPSGTDGDDEGEGGPVAFRPESAGGGREEPDTTGKREQP